jgi:transposase-like protein
MTKRSRRNHSAAFKAKVALAAMKGDAMLAQLAERFDVQDPRQVAAEFWSYVVGGGATSRRNRL